MNVQKSSRTSNSARRMWQRPVIECREARPEVTAYAGSDLPWLSR